MATSLATYGTGIADPETLQRSSLKASTDVVSAMHLWEPYQTGSQHASLATAQHKAIPEFLSGHTCSLFRRPRPQPFLELTFDHACIVLDDWDHITCSPTSLDQWIV